jgi:glycosyltransferase involved in cell wall biosynthesis
MSRRRLPQDDPVSVVIVDDALARTGTVRWVHTLAEQWATLGSSVRIFLLLDRQGDLAAVPAAGVPLTFGGRPGARLRHVLPRSLLALAREVVRADLVLVPSEVGVSVPLSYVACRMFRRPLVVMVQSLIDHSVTAWVPRRWRRLWLHCLRHADAVVCVSQGSADQLLRLGQPPERVSVVHPAIDVDEVVRAGSAPPQVVVDKREPVLLSCAELAPAKGHDLLLRAFGAVRAQGYRAQLVILGEGGERASLERLATDLGVEEVVHLPGFVANPYPEIQTADLFCLASRYEGFGLCLLEAMALGIPTVAADADGGGPRLLLDGGRLGALVPPNSVEELADAIVAHLDQPEELRIRAAAGPAYAHRFTAAAGAAAYQEIFRRITRRFPSDSHTAAAERHGTRR